MPGAKHRLCQPRIGGTRGTALASQPSPFLLGASHPTPFEAIDDTGELPAASNLRCTGLIHFLTSVSTVVSIYVTNLASCSKIVATVCFDRWSMPSAAKPRQQSNRYLCWKHQKLGRRRSQFVIASGVPSSDYTSFALSHILLSHSIGRNLRRDSASSYGCANAASGRYRHASHSRGEC